MVRTPEKNHLRAWRELRGMTQAQLAESVGTTGAVISLLESGARGLSDKWLRRLAPVLGTKPGHLLETDPADVDTDVMEIWADIPEEDRAQAREILNTFRRRRDPDPDQTAAAPQDPKPRPRSGGAEVVRLKPILRQRRRDREALEGAGETETGGEGE